MLIMNSGFMHRLAQEQMRLRLAEQFRGLRESRGWSLSKLAKLAGVQLRDVWRLQNGYLKHITIKTLTRIANAFDIALDIRFTSLLNSLSVGSRLMEDNPS